MRPLSRGSPHSQSPGLRVLPAWSDSFKAQLWLLLGSSWALGQCPDPVPSSLRFLIQPPLPRAFRPISLPASLCCPVLPSLFSLPHEQPSRNSPARAPIAQSHLFRDGLPQPLSRAPRDPSGANPMPRASAVAPMARPPGQLNTWDVSRIAGHQLGTGAA